MREGELRPILISYVIKAKLGRGSKTLCQLIGHGIDFSFSWISGNCTRLPLQTGLGDYEIKSNIITRNGTLVKSEVHTKFRKSICYKRSCLVGYNAI